MKSSSGGRGDPIRRGRESRAHFPTGAQSTPVAYEDMVTGDHWQARECSSETRLAVP